VINSVEVLGKIEVVGRRGWEACEALRRPTTLSIGAFVATME